MIALVDKVSKSFGGRTLYSNATLQLNAGERWALVGPNGAGKTTLLKIIMGFEASDEGTVTFAKDATLGYLEQEVEPLGKKSALQEVIDSAKEIKQWENTVNDLSHKISCTPEGDKLNKYLADYSHAAERFERLGGYELESRARQILSGLSFPVEDFDKPAQEFSGGWQMRINLSKLLLRRPDVLLLDEPTNHLDLESVQWLERFLSSYDGTVLLVSHDRSFMDACVTHVAALENRMLVTYTGNYSGYLHQREENLEQLRAKRAAQERDIAHMETFIERFRYKPTKAKQVQERVAKVQKIREELVVLPEQSHYMHFKFPDPPRTGDTVVSLENVAKSYEDNFVYSNVNLKLYRGDHVALVGPNGAGKSTLMKLIAGKIKPDTGTIALGQNVTKAYYAQHQLEELTPSNTVLAELDTVASGWTTSEERRLLGAFLFHGDDVEKRVNVLSGGERARLALAKMLVSPDPLLLLDEPTNHLNIDSVDVLEKALVNFPGTIIVISHDEHLVNAVANKVVDVRDHQVTVYDGDYAYFQFKRAELEAATSEEGLHTSIHGATSYGTSGVRNENNSKTTGQSVGTSRNVKTKEQRRAEAEKRNRRSRALRETKKRLQEVENALKPAHKRYDELMVAMADEALYNDPQKFDDCMTEYQALSKKIPALEAEWLELSEKMEADMDE